jgi:hypothetical protein
MMPTRPTAEPSVDLNNLINQLTMILRVSFSIEPKDREHVYQKPYPTTTTNSPTIEAIESLSFQV